MTRPTLRRSSSITAGMPTSLLPRTTRSGSLELSTGASPSTTPDSPVIFFLAWVLRGCGTLDPNAKPPKACLARQLKLGCVLCKFQVLGVMASWVLARCLRFNCPYLSLHGKISPSGPEGSLFTASENPFHQNSGGIFPGLCCHVSVVRLECVQSSRLVLIFNCRSARLITPHGCIIRIR